MTFCASAGTLARNSGFQLTRYCDLPAYMLSIRVTHTSAGPTAGPSDHHRTMSLFAPASPFWTSRLLAVLRVVIGVVFIMAGSMKAFGFPPPPAAMPPMTVIPPMWELHLASWLEIIGGTALICGFATRAVAFILSGEMAVAYWQVHNPVSPWLTASGGMPAAILCFTLLYMSAAGGGAWSIDGVIARSERGATR
jgi:putative oxidoreductase